MYYEFFGLHEPPFRITPDTRLFFPGGSRGAILDAIVYAITSGEGIVKVVGEVGSGKTMLCRMLEVKLPDTVEVVYLANPSLSPENILHAIAFEMKLPVSADAGRLEVMHALHARLLDKHAENRQVVVFVEEAQRMPIETLEEIRLLSNLETEREKLLQIVLFGQPELERNLRPAHIRQLKERITHSFLLPRLEAAEIREYLDFRMRSAGYRGPSLFSVPAVRRIARASQGLIRRINILADKALLAAYAGGSHEVTAREVRTAVRDSEFGRPRLAWDWRRGAGFTAGALAASAVALVLAGGVDLPRALQALVSGEGVAPASAGRVARGDAAIVPAEAGEPAPPPPPAPAQAAAPARPAGEPGPAAAAPVTEPLPGAVAASAAATPPEVPGVRGEGGGPAPVMPVSPGPVAPEAAPAPEAPATGVAVAPPDSPGAGPATAPVPVAQATPGPAVAAPAPERAQRSPLAPAQASVAGAPEAAAGPSPEPARPAVAAPADFLSRRLVATEAWLRSADAGRYSIQLMHIGIDRGTALEASLRQEGLAAEMDRVWVYRTRIRGEALLSVLVGDYASYEEARRALDGLPARLQQARPWVRNLRDIRGSAESGTGGA
jgi:type II secretory pathway predicted ATPase ExeA/septal ring-binding cell division protein DamX